MAKKRNPIAKHPITVEDLRRIIKGLPGDTKIVNDCVDSSDEFKAGIVSVEAGIPKNWQGVEGVESALWFHVRITPMEDEDEDDEAGDDVCDLCMTSGVHSHRTTYCGKTIGNECGCDESHQDGACGNPDCETCKKALEDGSELCKECGNIIPDVDGGGLANKHHKPSCSLYDPNIA